MKIPFLPPNVGLTILRCMTGLIFIVHSTYRTYQGTVGGFGEFLGSKGLPLGVVIAWFITLYEFIGGISLFAGRFTRFVACGFIVHQTMAILLLHLANGWFVVGGGTYGVEYSLLIISSCVALAANDNK